MEGADICESLAGHMLFLRDDECNEGRPAPPAVTISLKVSTLIERDTLTHGKVFGVEQVPQAVPRRQGDIHTCLGEDDCVQCHRRLMSPTRYLARLFVLHVPCLVQAGRYYNLREPDECLIPVRIPVPQPFPSLNLPIPTARPANLVPARTPNDSRTRTRTRAPAPHCYQYLCQSSPLVRFAPDLPPPKVSPGS